MSTFKIKFSVKEKKKIFYTWLKCNNKICNNMTKGLWLLNMFYIQNLVYVIICKMQNLLLYNTNKRSTDVLLKKLIILNRFCYWTFGINANLWEKFDQILPNLVKLI